MFLFLKYKNIFTQLVNKKITIIHSQGNSYFNYIIIYFY